MSGISVALSSMKHFVGASGELCETDLPVCIAEQDLGLFGENREVVEHMMSQVVLSMAKTVVVDTEKNSLFIGEDVNVEESALVLYVENSENPVFADSFFERWKATESMIFEYHAKCGSGVLFGLRGLWVRGSWAFIDIIPSARIEVVESD